jgi:hypothetical protein
LAKGRKLVCGAMIVVLMIAVLSTSLPGQNLGRAMLHSDGGAWLNGKPAPNSSAIFPNDLIQTRKESTAKIDVDGSTSTIQPGTMVQFGEDELFLDSGSLQVNSARGMRVRVNCMTVIPLTQEWTRYDVIVADGKLMVVAYENDVKIHYRRVEARQSKHAGFSDVTVHRGEQVTRDDRCRAEHKPAQALDAKGAILNSPWAKGAGITAIGVLTCWALCRQDEPVSPAKP